MKKLPVVLVVLVAFAATLSAQINFASGYQVYTFGMGSWGFIAKDPSRNILWADGSCYDLVSGGALVSPNLGQTAIDFDRNGDAYAVVSGNLVHQLVSGVSTTYSTASGLPGGVYSVTVDRANNRLIVGCTAGVSIVALDANENPASYTNALSQYGIHAAAVYGTDVWAINTYHVFRFDGKTWTMYDSTNSPIGNGCGAGDVDTQGNFYVATSKSPVSITMPMPYLAKFVRATQTWEKIDMSAIDSSWGNQGAMISGRETISQLKVDRNNQLWCFFPVNPTIGAEGWLVQMDLATGKIAKESSDSTWLNAYPEINLTVTRDIIVGGVGRVVIGTSANAVINPLRIAPIVERGKFQFIGTFNGRGQLISREATAFSNRNSASEMFFNLYRTSEGKVVRAEATAYLK